MLGGVTTNVTLYKTGALKVVVAILATTRNGSGAGLLPFCRIRPNGAERQGGFLLLEAGIYSSGKSCHSSK